MATPLSISLKVVGLDQAKADLRTFAEAGKRTFDEIEAEAKKIGEAASNSDRSLQALANRLRQTSAAIDPVTASAIKLRESLVDVQRGLQANLISTEQAARMTEFHRQKHEDFVQTVTKSVSALTRMSGELREFGTVGRQSFEQISAAAKGLAGTALTTEDALTKAMTVVRGLAAEMNPAAAAALKLREQLAAIATVEASGNISPEVAAGLRQQLQLARELADQEAALATQRQAAALIQKQVTAEATAAEQRAATATQVHSAEVAAAARTAATAQKAAAQETAAVIKTAEEQAATAWRVHYAEVAAQARAAAAAQQAAAQSAALVEKATALIQKQAADEAKKAEEQATTASRVHYAEVAARARLAGEAVKGTAQQTTISAAQARFAVQQFGFQINDVATQLASGANPFRVATQQAGQFVQAFQVGGGPAAVLRGFVVELKSLISPTTVAIAGLAALGVGFIALVARSTAADAAMRQFAVTLEAMNLTAKATPAGLEAVSHSFLDLGISVSEARTQLNQLATSGLDPQRWQAIIRAAANLQTVFGGDQFQNLKNAFAGGVESASTYALKLRLITTDQAAYARQLVLSGDAGKALDFILQQVTARSDDWNKRALSPLGQALRDLNVAYDKFVTTLSKSDAIRGVVEQTTALVRVIEDLFKKEPPKWFRVLFMDEAVPGLGNIVTQLLRMQGIPVTGSGPGGISGPAPAAGGAASGAGAGPLSVTITKSPSAVAGLDPTLQFALRDMFAAAAESGITLGIGSGFRTFEQQTKLYNEAIAKYGSANIPGHQVAYPGTSMHEKGLAADLTASGTTIRAGSPEARWLAANASTFGISFPVRGEPWHAQLAGDVVPAGGRTGLLTAVGEQDPTKIDAVNKLIEAETRRANALRGMGQVLTENEVRERAATIALENELTVEQKARVEAALLANSRATFNNELDNSNKLLNQEISGQQSIVQAYQASSLAGKVRETQFKAETEALRLFGTTDSAVAKQFIENRTKQNLALEKASEQLKSAQEILAGRDTQAQLQLQMNLVGQTSEEIQRQVTILQEKQRIEREFPLLSEAEKAAKLKVTEEIANQTKLLADMNREQQRIDGLYRQIGDTIVNTLGQALDSVFDPKKPMDWGKSIKNMLSSLVGTIGREMLFKPLTGSILSTLGASPSTVQQYGTLGGSGGLFGNIGSLGSTGSFLKSILPESWFSGGGLFSNIGSSLGFASTAPVSSVFGIESSTLSSLGLTGNMAVPGSVFGMTSLGSALGSVGAGFTAGTMINSLVGGKSTGGMIGSGVGSIAGMAIGSLIGMPFLGALLGGVGGGLFGGMFGNNRPRNQSAGFSTDVSTFQIQSGFAGGNQQIDQAVLEAGQKLQGYLDLLKTTGGALSGQLLLQHGVNTGVTLDYSGVPGYGSGRLSLGQDPTKAVGDVALVLAKTMTGVSDTFKSVMDSVSDPAKLERAIAFAKAYEAIDEAAEDAFASIEDATKRMGPYRVAIDEINATFADLTEQAKEFGQAIPPITAALDEAISRLRGDFKDSLQRALNEATGAGFINTIKDIWDQYLASITDSQAIGLGSDRATQDLLGQVATNQIRQVLEGLSVAELDTVIAEFTGLNDIIVELAQTAKLTTDEVDQLASQLAQIRLDIQRFVDSIRGTAGPGASPEQAYYASVAQWGTQYDLASRGDMNALQNITGYAQQYIDAISGYFGSSQAGQVEIDRILANLEALAPTTIQDPVVQAITVLTEAVTTGTTTVTSAIEAIPTSLQVILDANTLAATQAIYANNSLLEQLRTDVNASAETAKTAIDTQIQQLITDITVQTSSLIGQGILNTQSLIDANNTGFADVTAQYQAETDRLIASGAATTAQLQELNTQTATDIINEAGINADDIIAESNQRLDDALSKYDETIEGIGDVSTDAQGIITAVNATGTLLAPLITAVGTDVVAELGDGPNSVVGSIVSELAAVSGYQIRDRGFNTGLLIEAIGLVGDEVNAAALVYSNNEISKMGTVETNLLSSLSFNFIAVLNALNSISGYLLTTDATNSLAIANAVIGGFNNEATAMLTYANGEQALLGQINTTLGGANGVYQTNHWLYLIQYDQNYFGWEHMRRFDRMIELLVSIDTNLKLSLTAPVQQWPAYGM
jgi:chemotaxis protein histidine kinase CheA